MRLKARLEEEGLFSPDYKRSIPVSPRRIGIVTSPTGAALRDMLNTLQRRYPLAEVILAPTPVQGNDAPSKIVAAIQDLNRLALPDVILVARGGGSIEDLWSFNDESVARAIAASEAPVISGIGHETDFTIADFVSDLRAPTPTAAAELATPNRTDLIIALSDLSSHMSHTVQNDLATRRRELENQNYRLDQRSPLALVRSGRQRLDELERLAALALKHHIQVERTRLAGQAARLTALNPSAVLQRGFSIVTQMDGSLVNSAEQVYPGDMLNIIVQDGKFIAQVQDTPSNNQ
jgi:exodeoxyribonuclease VII large subunit